MTTTKEILQGMLTENTGRHFLDSGGAYGRNWERNQSTDFDKVPVTSLSFERWEHPRGTSQEVSITHDVYHWLLERLDFSEDVDACEEEGNPLSGEIMDQLPTGDAVLSCYLAWAERAIRTIEESIGMGIVEACYRACAVPAIGNTTHSDADTLEDAETFGHYIAMQAVGHGVSWADDHPDLPFVLPNVESPNCFLTGETSIAILEA